MSPAAHLRVLRSTRMLSRSNSTPTSTLSVKGLVSATASVRHTQRPVSTCTRTPARTHALRMHTSACYGIRPLLWRPANAHQQSRHHHGTPPCTPALYPAPNPGAMPHPCTRALHLSAALERCTRPLHATAAPERCTRALRPSTVLPMRPYVNAGREWLRGLRDPQRMSMADQPLW